MADLASNDKAYEQVESVIRRLARTLDFEYSSSNGLSPSTWTTEAVSSATLPIPSPPIFGQIYRTLPHAFGLFAVQEDVRVCCRTRMRSQLLHEHVKEKLGLDKNTKLDVKQGEITLHHEQLVKLQLSLPNGLSLVLSPTGPDVTGIMKSELRFEDQFRSLFKEQEQGALSIQKVLNIYRNHYISLRAWTCRVGLLSKECRLLSESDLASRYTGLFLGVALDQMNLRHDPTLDVMPRSRFEDFLGILSPMPLPSHHLAMVRQTMMSTPASPSDDYVTLTVNALNLYLKTYSAFVKVDASCWNMRQQSKLGQHRFINRIRDLASRIQAACSKKSSKQLSIWPEFLLTSHQTENITMLIGWKDDTDKSEEDAVRKACQAELYHSEELFELGSMVEYSIIPRDRLLQELGDLTIIAQNLPAVWALHLDIPPIADPHALSETIAENNTDPPSNKPSPQQTRFRPSQEVLSRMQWDTQHASKRYEVGYVDRFEKELLWKSVEEWTNDAQEDDFVPMHRIRQFREVGTGTVVWDRDLKLDRTSELGG